MAKFTVCLPQDLADARAAGQSSARDQWNQWTQRWADEAGPDRAIAFELWGDSEITDLLRKPHNAGASWYWFRRDLFGHDWFERKLDEAMANAGPRYTAELNVDVPAARYLSALARDNAFFDRVHSLCVDVRQALRQARLSAHKRFETSPGADLTSIVLDITERVGNMPCEPEVNVPFDEVQNLCEQGIQTCDECVQGIRDDADRLTAR